MNSMEKPCLDPSLFMSVVLAVEDVLVMKKLIKADGER